MLTTPSLHPRLREALSDLLLVAVICGAGFWWGSAYWNRSREAGRAGVFYQHYFEPAVMVACGKGFVISQPPQFPAMQEFVLQRVDRFSCDQIPADVVLGSQGLYQGAWRYLLTAVGLAWRVLGITWSGMAPIFGVLFALTLTSVYGIFRLAVGRGLAVAGVVALMLSTLHLMNLPHLRDYAKAPFVLTVIFTLGLAVTRPFTWPRAIGTGLAAGMVLGIGYGFRTDFLVLLPFTAVTFLCFAGPLEWRSVPRKLTAVAVFAVTFVALAWPILTVVNQRGGCQWHVAILGLADQFTSELRVAPGPYDVGYGYFDDFAHREVSSHAARTAGHFEHIEDRSRDYDAASAQYLLDVARTVPADFATRAVAAVIGTLRLPSSSTGPPLRDWLSPIYVARNLLLRVLAVTAVVVVPAAIAVVALVSPRVAMFLLFSLLYLGGYPAIQYANRHYFHLEFIGWLAWLMLLRAAWIWMAAARHVGPKAALEQLLPDRRARSRRLLVATAIVIVALVVPMAALRWYQQDRLERVFQTYIDAPKQVLHPEAAGGAASVTMPDLRWYPAETELPAQKSALLEVRLQASQCAPGATITFRYDPSKPHLDFTRTVSIAHSSEPAATRVFFPVFDNFVGLDFTGVPSGCLEAVSQLNDVQKLPLLIAAVLPPGWERLPLYQRLDP